MNYSKLENILKMETTAEKHILNSLSLFNKSTLTDKEIITILNPILHYKVENNLLILNDNMVLIPDENVTISKHHRYIKVPNHKHNFIELIYVYSGSCTQTINGLTITLKTGEILKVYQNQTNELAITNKKDCTHNIADILEYIENNYSTATLTSTAEHFHFHPNYLDYRQIIQRYNTGT